MNLKEAFRFQNKLGALMEEAQDVLDRDANITRVENTYLRKKVYDGAENETVDHQAVSGRAGLQRTGGGDIRVHFGMAGVVSERGEQIPHLPDL